MMARTSRNIVERLERHALEMKEGECWITDLKGRNQFGHIRIRPEWNVGSPLSIHRVAWEMHNAEPIPEGMQINHTCDNPACFNPDHLYVGTQADNNNDIWDRGRVARGPDGRFQSP